MVKPGVPPMSPDLRKAIMEEKGTDELREIALDEGMLTLRMDGLKKVKECKRVRPRWNDP